MNKADEKRLHRDPRYKRIKDAHAKLAEAKAKAREMVDAALREFWSVAPEANSHGDDDDDESLFNVLRPKGDRVPVRCGSWTGRAGATSSEELESVTATKIRTTVREFKIGGDGNAYWAENSRSMNRNTVRISVEDVERIRRGDLKGWRDKPWGS